MNDCPCIGITTYAANGQGELTLPIAYVQCVRRAGGAAVLLPPGEPNLEAIVARLDGLILAGGGDVCPARYLGMSHEMVYGVNDQRDASEIQLVELLLQHQLPTLAICRGLQVLNVALGGSLHPHIPDAFGQQVQHRAPPRQPTPHEVQVVADSQLERTLAIDHAACLSWHHQSVDRLGEGCRVAARAVDGVIEAIEVEQHPQLLAVQWHPELTADEDPIQQRLFDELVRRAIRYRQQEEERGNAIAE